jgi:hypothetical protein
MPDRFEVLYLIKEIRPAKFAIALTARIAKFGSARFFQ